MTDPQTLPRLLEAELDRLEGVMELHLQGAITHTLYGDTGHIQAYGQLLKLQALVSSRRAMATDAREPQRTQSERRLHYQETLDVLNTLIGYHKSHGQDNPRPCMLTVEYHRRATETLYLLRNHLDRCYEVRS